ncbi:MAG: NAD(P)/FAD-dependent oxidoreductase, partial [Acidobacteriota bacterium]
GRRVGDDGGDFTAAMARARELQGELAIFTDADQLCRQGVDVFFGSGRFVAADAVEVEQHRLRFRRALISTGARPVAPAVPGFEDIDFLTPETLFQLEELPAAMAILGDNAEACEMAQAFADLGSRVHLLTSAPRLLPRADATGAEAITRAVSEAGVEVITACDLVEIQPRRAHAGGHLTIVTTDHAGFEVDQILVTGHSTPNVEQLGLEAAGVEYDLDGIEVDSRFRTTSRHIYAAGDVLAPVGIEHAADDEGRRAVRNAALPRLVRRRPFAVPHAAFTRPEVAWVGLDAETATMMNAKKVGAKVETLTLPLHERQAAHRPEALHLYLERRSGRILGGVLIADGATEMIAPLVLAVRRRMRLETLAQSLVPYPAKGEIYRRAALLWERDRRRPPRNLLELWLRLT